LFDLQIDFLCSGLDTHVINQTSNAAEENNVDPMSVRNLLQTADVEETISCSKRKAIDPLNPEIGPSPFKRPVIAATPAAPLPTTRGSSCVHGRRKDRCKQCGGGSSFCVHGRRRWECRDCGGSSICPHNRRRSRCRECGGVSICQHGRERWTCRACSAASFCEHGRQRSKCAECVSATMRDRSNRNENSPAVNAFHLPETGPSLPWTAHAGPCGPGPDGSKVDAPPLLPPMMTTAATSKLQAPSVTMTPPSVWPPFTLPPILLKSIDWPCLGPVQPHGGGLFALTRVPPHSPETLQRTVERAPLPSLRPAELSPSGVNSPRSGGSAFSPVPAPRARAKIMGPAKQRGVRQAEAAKAGAGVGALVCWPPPPLLPDLVVSPIAAEAVLDASAGGPKLGIAAARLRS
jgi:hypothetical protein